jgi:hypothetical protein
MNAPLVTRTIAGVGSVARRRDQARPESDEPGGADEIGFIGLTSAQRQLARDLHRIGADAVIGRDAAQSAQARVERRPLAQRRRGLHHRRLAFLVRGLPRRTFCMRLDPRAGAASHGATVANDHRSPAS